MELCNSIGELDFVASTVETTIFHYKTHGARTKLYHDKEKIHYYEENLYWEISMKTSYIMVKTSNIIAKTSSTKMKTSPSADKFHQDEGYLRSLKI